MEDSLKLEPLAERCCVCGAGDELYAPEEHDADAPPNSAPLRAMMLHLNNNKPVPDGRLCSECIRRTVDSYNFSVSLASKGAPSLSEKIQTLRKRLHELTQKIDVFIVVGGASDERDVVRVRRDELAPAPAAARDARGERVYQCTVCPDTFTRVSEYRAHVSSHGPGAVHCCWWCGAQFSEHAAALAHADSHAPALQCHVCNETFQSAASLRRHEASCVSCPGCGALPAPGAAPGRCGACGAGAGAGGGAGAGAGRRGPAGAALRRRAPYVCAHLACGARTATRASLLAHIRARHAASPPRAAPPATHCALCQRDFGSVAALKRHSTRVHRDKETLVSESEGVEYLEEDAHDVKHQLQMMTSE